MAMSLTIKAGKAAKSAAKNPSKKKKKLDRKVDTFAQSEGSLANKLMLRRKMLESLK